MHQVAKNHLRREEIFREEECPHKTHIEYAQGCCPCLQSFQGKEADIWELPRSNYALTADSLRIIETEWADNWKRDQEREIQMRPRCGMTDFLHCGVCYGYEPDDPPQSMTKIDNIDLSSVQDVDTLMLNPTKKEHWPSCYGRIFGYKKATHVQYPAHIKVTYIDRGALRTDATRASFNELRKTRTLFVEPGRVEAVSQMIIQGMEDHQG